MENPIPIKYKRKKIRAYELGGLIYDLIRIEYKGETYRREEVRQKRMALKDLLGKNPNLQFQMDEILPKAYKYALAIQYDSRPSGGYPKGCPYTIQQCLDDKFYPNNN